MEKLREETEHEPSNGCACFHQIARKKILNRLLESVSDSLKKGDEVRLVGFGTFKTSKRAAKIGRNPRTGVPLKIKASVRPKFVPGKSLVESLN